MMESTRCARHLVGYTTHDTTSIAITCTQHHALWPQEENGGHIYTFILINTVIMCEHASSHAELH